MLFLYSDEMEDREQRIGSVRGEEDALLPGHVLSVGMKVPELFEKVDNNTVMPAYIGNPLKPFGTNPPICLQKGFLMDFPMSTLEQELRRIYAIVDAVMKEHQLTYWPADGTLLGIIRQGRVANDRDLDFHVLTTMEDCKPLLRSLGSSFKKLANLTYFKVISVRKRHLPYYRMGMFAMVRMMRKFGFFNTGVDLTCVHRQPNGSHTVFNHFGRLMLLPNNSFPLIPCRAYDMTVLCPGDGYRMLEAFKPRYEGCMVFPHCFGDPETSHVRCLTPHPLVPLKHFIDATTTLKQCGYVNLVDHYSEEPLCAHLMNETRVLENGVNHSLDCRVFNENKFCFLQKFNG
ncbi:putative membrane-associated protein [Trypanosoma theileri]|uniref:Putative membrane-associated protein n=1 Tax=Trypanosoma theileri TaxID=67003 RepID=A0A1X0NP93_9TRYP|nr:putative membrane-associated protein [Trypanosoma theileri]ORC86532.1 putative membrane-associated protein [Trypanosoma theileri]